MYRTGIRRMMAVIILAVSLFSMGGTAYGSEVAKETAEITEEYAGVAKETASLVNSLKNETAVAEVLLEGLTEEDVMEPSVLTDLEEAITAAMEACTVTVEETEYPANPFAARKMAEADLNAASASLETVAEAKDALSEAMEAVSASMEEKQLSDARASLEETITEAEELAESAADTITGADVLEALETAIGEAEALLEDGDASELEDMEETLTSAMADAEQAVKEAEEAAAVAARKAAEAARAASASQASASSSASSSAPSTSASSSSSASSQGSAGDVWYCEVAYSDYSATSGDANGALTQWRDGYYIAHSNSSNGKKIASRPAYVVVNGQKYKYVSSKVVSTSTTWSQIESYVHANGGIGFQTCTSGGYLVTHYEPV